MAQIFLNNARAVLAADITAEATQMTVNSVVGFPASLGANDWFLLTIYQDTTRYGENLEVVEVTGLVDNGDGTWTLTLVRGVEMPAAAHTAAEKIEARLTAGTLEALQVGGISTAKLMSMGAL